MKLIKLVRTFLTSLLFSIVIPGALLFVLDYISAGSGSGGAFDLPNLPQFLILLVIGVLALPFIIGTLVFGLPIAALIEANSFPVLSNVALPVRYGTLTISGHTATAAIVGLIVQVVVWAIILYSADRLKQVKSRDFLTENISTSQTVDYLRQEAAKGSREEFEAFLAAIPEDEPMEEDRLKE